MPDWILDDEESNSLVFDAAMVCGFSKAGYACIRRGETVVWIRAPARPPPRGVDPEISMSNVLTWKRGRLPSFPPKKLIRAPKKLIRAPKKLKPVARGVKFGRVRRRLFQ